MGINKIITALALSAAMTATGDVWTLDQCIEYAHAHDINIALKKLDEVNGQHSITEAKDAFLPTVSASAGQNFDFGRGLTSENTYANRNTQNFGWNVGLNLPLFQGLRAVRTLDYAKANLRALVEQTEAVKDNVTLNVMAQYLQALYAGEVVKVAERQYANACAELARRDTLAQGGKIPEVDVIQARSQVASDEITLVSARNDRRMAILALAQTLSLENADDMEVAPLDTELPILPAVADVYASALGINHSMLAANADIDAAKRNVEVARTGYIPTLSFNAGLASSFYRISGFSNPGFSQQMRDNFSKSLGFTLSVPVFDAFRTRNSLRRAKTAVLSAELRRDDARQQLYQAIQQASCQAETAAAKARVSDRAAGVAAESFAAVTDKYNLGRATPTGFEQARLTLFQAQTSAIQARYEALLRARILLFYASGR